jgi:hypothetical protein
MTVTAHLLAALEAITQESVGMLDVLNSAEGLSQNDRREAKRRVFEIRGRAQELFEWLSEVRLEEPRN